MKEFLNILKRVLNAETRIVVEYRAKYNRIMIKPTTICFFLLVVFYLLSPIDLIPEAVVAPLFFGYVDDLVAVLFAVFIIYNDINHEMFDVDDDDLSEDWSKLHRKSEEVKLNESTTTTKQSSGSIPFRRASSTERNGKQSEVSVDNNSAKSNTSTGSSGDGTNSASNIDYSEFACDSSGIDSQSASVLHSLDEISRDGKQWNFSSNKGISSSGIPSANDSGSDKTSSSKWL